MALVLVEVEESVAPALNNVDESPLNVAKGSKLPLPRVPCLWQHICFVKISSRSPQIDIMQKYLNAWVAFRLVTIFYLGQLLV